MAYGRRSTTTSILEVFSLNPLPYPVLLILAVASIFLGISWYFSYEEAVESAEEQLSWALFVVPILLLLVVRWLSSMENPDALFATSPWDRRRRTHHRPSEGSSPWGVAALIVLLLVLLQYQSIFRDSWLI
ncbi:Transmembrane protein [Trema orientale]|uniref:Transmembrane protein n=1 Tax=Trema orientale TaxID=63057 RepID=A0A2P5ED05_TREOI|nr:Transmembrane protein [Trema orientale]